MQWNSFGRYDIAAIETGRFRLDGGAMFGVVPRNLWEKHNPPDEKNRIAMTMRTLVLRDAERVILVDAGVGRKDSPKFRDIFAIDFSDVNLESGLAALGLQATDVTDVVVTHLHFDHIGGAVSREDDALRLTFPRAMHHVQRAQWEWAISPSQRDRASYIPDNFLPLEEAGRLQLLDVEEELFPGMRVEVIDGHTFGQQLLRLTEGDQSVVFAADLIPMSSHVPEAWIMGYDLQPLVTLEEKRRLLTLAVERQDILIYEHDAFCEASLVRRDDKGYRAHEHGTLDHVLHAAGRGGA
ncbi:MAG: MBL fold metallo-hydrolase [Bacteroidota bacterium]|nr:MBL fold metallo-hydrolase [Bacteroidota bacterium]